jgi:hypothetical protein
MGRRARHAALLLAFAWTARARGDASKLVPEVGYNYGEIETGRSAAMGGASRAFGSGITGVFENPANIALTRVYHLQALAQIWPEARKQAYGLGAVDSVSGPIAGAITGQYGVLDPDGVRRKWTDIRLALALTVSDRFYVGITGKYLKLSDSGPPLTGFGLPPSPAAGGLPDQASVENITFDVGATAKPTEQIAIGVMGSNVTNPGTGFQPLSVGGGVGFGNNDVTVEGDVLADFTTFTDGQGDSRTKTRFMFGFEFLAADHYPLRVGYKFDTGIKTHALSLGVGYIDPKFSVDFAIRHTISGSEPYGPVTSIIIDLQYFLEASGLVRESELVGKGPALRGAF